MSTDNTGTDADTPDPDAQPTSLYGLVVDVEEEARSLDALEPGAGRAAWVLDQVEDRAPGQLVLWPDRWGTDYSCTECNKAPQHPAVQVVVATDQGGAGVLAGPLCPTCGIRKLKKSLR